MKSEPYRIFFPLGVVLSWAGVLPWLLFAFGLFQEWVPVFHAMTQIEGFLACIAAGFLLTMIPRRTATPEASSWEIAILAAAPVAAVVLSWFERWAIVQVFWLAFLAVLARFALRRFRARTAKQRVPASFVLVISAIVLGALGAVLAGVGAALEQQGMWWLHEAGRDLVLQGVVSCLVVGVGTLIVPHVTRGEPPRELPRALYVGSALLVAASFFVEQLISAQLGLALRAAVLALAFVPGAELWKKPTKPGLHRWLCLVACWALPAGFALAAVFPHYRKACLHVVFIGCYATLVFALALHVVLTHAGRAQDLERRQHRLSCLGGLLATALAARIVFDLDQEHARLWLGIGASAFVLATLVWLSLTVRALAEAPETQVLRAPLPAA